MCLQMRSVSLLLSLSPTVMWANIILPTPLTEVPVPSGQHRAGLLTRRHNAVLFPGCAGPVLGGIVHPPLALGVTLDTRCRRMGFLFSVCLQPFVPGLS